MGLTDRVRGLVKKAKDAKERVQEISRKLDERISKAEQSKYIAELKKTKEKLGKLKRDEELINMKLKEKRLRESIGEKSKEVSKSYQLLKQAKETISKGIEVTQKAKKEYDRRTRPKRRTRKKK